MTSMKVWALLLLPLSLVSLGTADCPFPVFNGKNVVLSSESILKNSFPDNSEAFVECAKGYVREDGSTSITCLNGNWSPVNLICKKMDCGQPKPSLHMRYIISNGTLFGAYIKNECEMGYDLEGSSYRQCLVSGWSGKAKCILTTCDLPDPVEHGKMVAPRDIPEFNDVITFFCDDNYILVGNGSITCGEYGDYSSPPPKCIESTTTNKATTTDMTTASTRSHVITTPTKASTTTNKATTMDITTASTRSHVITTPTKASTTTNKATATDMTTASTRSHVITTPTKASTTTNKATTTDMTTASTRSHVITTPTKASTTTNKATTTDMTTASTRSHGGLKEGHTTDSKSALSIPFLIKAAPPIIVALLIITALFVVFLVYRQLKHKGSYNTGEELRTKEELLLNQSV